jgi:hypothetical protein
VTDTNNFRGGQRFPTSPVFEGSRTFSRIMGSERSSRSLLFGLFAEESKQQLVHIALEGGMRFPGSCARKTGVHTGHAPIAIQIDGGGIGAEVRNLGQFFFYLRDCAGVEQG